MSNLHFKKYVINNVLNGIAEQVNYDLICKIDQIVIVKENDEQDTKSIGINILLRTTIRDVEIIQCAPFYLTVTSKKFNVGSSSKFFFSIGKMAVTPHLIHVSMFETSKLDLELYIEDLENSGYFDNHNNTIKNISNTTQDIKTIRLSNIEFTFYNSLRECIVYINGARVICVKYSSALKRFISHFLNGLIEVIRLGVKELEST